MGVEYKEFGYPDAAPAHTAAYLLPAIHKLLPTCDKPQRILDVGCGNGYIPGQFLARGHRVVGIDLSPEGIELARKTYPNGRFELMAADEKLLENLGEAPFDVVISTEVVEHLYSPRPYARGCFLALRPGGRFILSTPYHGYWKNLAVAVLGRFDQHASPLWDGGHIKLWSRNTLSVLLKEAGFENIQFRGAGRLPYLWMSMVMSGDRPV
ncbi:MAG TPA: class I SAM-dependent methyltransferase [Tepidisphaeraceae bacterium]|jgi:2-polyprenyl-6-hydroxyphenyl methylase/3-demethylubiquinone-9 3-methyltransferase|nr:class I SAM-dependent methyltransferase [Tepidisphaeraceae bacterium]HEV8607774.1 class I SAM-dependent methyltransferase [Tepidisphaeraceae bacterium]